MPNIQKKLWSAPQKLMLFSVSWDLAMPCYAIDILDICRKRPLRSHAEALDVETSSVRKLPQNSTWQSLVRPQKVCLDSHNWRLAREGPKVPDRPVEPKPGGANSHFTHESWCLVSGLRGI